MLYVLSSEIGWGERGKAVWDQKFYRRIMKMTRSGNESLRKSRHPNGGALMSQ